MPYLSKLFWIVSISYYSEHESSSDDDHEEEDEESEDEEEEDESEDDFVPSPKKKSKKQSPKKQSPSDTPKAKENAFARLTASAKKKGAFASSPKPRPTAPKVQTFKDVNRASKGVDPESLPSMITFSIFASSLF